MCNHPALLPEPPGVIRMEFIVEIRRRHLVDGESISSIARNLKKSRPTVRKALKTLSEPVYHRVFQPLPKLGRFRLSWNSGWRLSPAWLSGSGARRSVCLRGYALKGIWVPTIRYSVS